MSVSRQLFDLRFAGLYLPALVLITLQPDLPFLFIIVLLSLLAAIYFHGLSRNAFGVGGPEENPLSREEAIQEMTVAVTGLGPGKDLPGTPRGSLNFISSNILKIPIKKWIFIISGIISIAVWPVGVVISLYFGTIQLSQLSTGEQFLVFAEYVWVFQWMIWRFYTPSYLLDEGDFQGDEEDENEEVILEEEKEDG